MTLALTLIVFGLGLGQLALACSGLVNTSVINLVITLTRLRDCDTPNVCLPPPSVSDKLVSDDDDGTLRGDHEVPDVPRSDASNDLRFFHGSARLFHAGSLDSGALSAGLCFNLFNAADDDVNFFAPNNLCPRRPVPFVSMFSAFVSMPGFGPPTSAVERLTFSLSGDNMARYDLRSTTRLTLLADVIDGWSAVRDGEDSGFLTGDL